MVTCICGWAILELVRTILEVVKPLLATPPPHRCSLPPHTATSVAVSLRASPLSPPGPSAGVVVRCGCDSGAAHSSALLEHTSIDDCQNDCHCAACPPSRARARPRHLLAAGRRHLVIPRECPSHWDCSALRALLARQAPTGTTASRPSPDSWEHSAQVYENTTTMLAWIHRT